jgi:hypothetical protein
MKLFDAQLTPRRIVIAVLIAGVLSLPSLWAGFLADDYLHLMVAGGYEVGAASRFDLYRQDRAVRADHDTDPRDSLTFMFWEYM